MNLNYLTQRKHIFKKRVLRTVLRNLKLRLGQMGFFSLRPQRFELVYIRTLKKVIKRRFVKKRMKFRPNKFWLFLKPNCILSCKSVNSRMGAGTGSLVRVAIKLQSYMSFVEFRNYSPLYLRRVHEYTRYRLPLRFFVWSPQ